VERSDDTWIMRSEDIDQINMKTIMSRH